MPRDRLFDNMRTDDEIQELDAGYGDEKSKLDREDSVGDKFHQHLDECEQCRAKPFGLCPVGAELLLAIPKQIDL